MGSHQPCSVCRAPCVIDDDMFPTHATLRMTLDGNRVIKERRAAWKPLGIGGRVQKGFKDLPDNIDEKGKHKIEYKEYLATFHIFMDKHYDDNADNLNRYLREKDTTSFYQLWSKIPEQATKEFFEMGAEEAKMYSGRARISIRTTRTKGSPTIKCDEQDDSTGIIMNHTVEKTTRRLQAQATRCNAWLQRNKARTTTPSNDPKLKTFDVLDRNERQAL